MKKQQDRKTRAKAKTQPKKPASARDAAKQYLEENKDIALAVEAMRTARIAQDSMAQYRGRRVYRVITS